MWSTKVLPIVSLQDMWSKMFPFSFHIQVKFYVPSNTISKQVISNQWQDRESLGKHHYLTSLQNSMSEVHVSSDLLQLLQHTNSLPGGVGITHDLASLGASGKRIGTWNLGTVKVAWLAFKNQNWAFTITPRGNSSTQTKERCVSSLGDIKPPGPDITTT